MNAFTERSIRNAEALRKARSLPKGAKGAIPNYSIHLVKGKERGRPLRENWSGRIGVSA